jgi:hypothetical protein
MACAQKQTTPAAAPAVGTDVATYTSSSGHFALEYPSDWASKPTKEFALLLESEPTPDSAQVSVDVPDIPPHLPGMMTMRLVVNGYVDDQRKRLSDLSVVERSDAALAGASAQRLVITGRKPNADRQGQARIVTALIAIRGEQVYILQADATPESFDAARDAMARIAQNWNWTR